MVCGAPGDPAWNNDVQAKLQATGQFDVVDIYNISAGTPTLTDLQAYDAVLTFTDGSASNSVLMGDNLAAYIDGGGGVVNCVFANASVPIDGNFNTSTYQVVVPSGQNQNTQLTLGTVLDPSHPVMQGVNSLDGGTASYVSTSTTLAPGASTIAQWNNGSWLVAVKENVGPAKSRRVDLNLYPPSIDVRSDFWNSAADGGLLMANALTWTIRPRILVAGAEDDNVWLQDVADKILATGKFGKAALYNIYVDGTPTVAELDYYDAVLVFTDYGAQDDILLGDNLAAYIDNGGGVVNAVFSTASVPIAGAFNTSTYQVMVPSGNQTDGTTLYLGTVYNDCHPIIKGITNLNGGSASFISPSVTLAAGATMLADWDNGVGLVAYKTNVGVNNARRADLNFFPPSSDSRSDLWDASTQGGDLMANALYWVAGYGDEDGLPNVTVSSPVSTVCTYGTQVALTGTPVGGSWSGNGISGTSFDPTTVTVGNYTLTYSYTDVDGCSNSDSLAIVVDACAGVEDLSLVNNISLYPNPSNGMINVSFGTIVSVVQVEVIDLSGKVVASTQWNNVQNGAVKQIDLTEQSAGVYFVRFTGNGQTQTEKLILQK